jgi:hypothetical protein
MGSCAVPELNKRNRNVFGQHVDNTDRMANSYTASRKSMEVDKKDLFPLVGTGHCQQLHPFIFMWWEENLTQRFLTHPYQRYAGTFWV